MMNHFLHVLLLLPIIAAFSPLQPSRRRTSVVAPPLRYQSGDYLSSLTGGGPAQASSPGSPVPAPTSVSPVPAPAQSPTIPAPTKQEVSTFIHATRSYFDIDKLTPKGPRTNADVGQPHDSTRDLWESTTTSVGSWWCAAGGWPSPNQRATTEVFYVLSGHGCLTDLDNTPHYFGPGDIVVLPKGWSGRWDVLADIHKVWVVHDHSQIEEKSRPIRATTCHYHELSPQFMTKNREGVSSRTIYNVGPTQVGSSIYKSGSSLSINSSSQTTTSIHVLEGRFFLTNADNSARKCVAGDTVILPKGWTGSMQAGDESTKIWWVETPE